MTTPQPNQLPEEVKQVLAQACAPELSPDGTVFHRITAALTPYLAPRPPAQVDAGWAKRAASHIVTPLDVWHDEPDRLKVLAWVEAIILRHAPDHSALLAEVGRLTKERDELKEAGGKIGDEKLANLTERIESEYPAFGNDMPQYKAMRSWRIKRWVGDIFGEKLYGLVDELATLRQERDELRAELLTTHQMACRVGLERDELAKLLGEAADELAVPGYDAPPISKGVQNLLSRIRAALQSLRALTEQPGKP